MNSPVYTEWQHIDRLKWDRAIVDADNSNIYARSFMLDLMSPGWSALILNDYEVVMPLTWRKKFGVRYLCQPPFLQQLGIFGKHIEPYVPLFLNRAKEHFRFAEIFLNHQQGIATGEPRQNFVIDLKKEYRDIMDSYTSVHHKNLKRAVNASLVYKGSRDYASTLELNYSLYGRKSGVKKQAYEKLMELAQQKPEHILVREVWKQEECQAASFCLIDNRRIYFILSAVTPSGKKNQANHFLVDQLIREFSGSSMILDFEGSDIPGIADFYRGFGAVDEPYYFCKWNHLPWPYRLFKK